MKNEANDRRRKCLKLGVKFLIIFLFVFTFLCIKHFLTVNNENSLSTIPVTSSAVALNDNRLSPRGHWNWIANAAVSGFLISAAGLMGGWAINVCVAPANPACWVTAGTTLVLGAIGAVFATAAGRPGNGWTSANTKRDVSSVEYQGFIYTKISHENQSTIATALERSNYTLDAIWVVTPNTTNHLLLKRDGSDGDAMHVLQWSTPMGNHVGIHLDGDLQTMVNDIVADSAPGSLESTLRYTKTYNHTKRYNNFDAKWVSYGWDNGNSDLAKIAMEDRPLEEEEYDKNLYTEFNNMPAWKYCWAVTDNPHPGQGEGYDDIGKENVMHGELYFNTFGGIDNYCNDSKDGAQCPDDACDI
ncbi:DUF5341 domain-containing protein NDAI_0H04050 [Naumovozyma dairenensis CBS 421]|uniref:Uncharacterized protein n=1 Tax=Naumovozyma dairenensis (strain ATCC 10597 / BCRC 20456 / CBS 421 / NBRC 0211 / NRRL Y-12639) TaxID=1071378 RepID=G0WFL7_NAUDC|nr:hypothetical protein NDAI_0H04050 [Naumovozyma dairenensis CBS 421]CCD26578.1 hypothetical protein NDAI_0H04050 [Naumovozyma dairenensis CBS 421]